MGSEDTVFLWGAIFVADALAVELNCHDCRTSGTSVEFVLVSFVTAVEF